MNNTERFVVIMNILNKHDLSNCSRNHGMFNRVKYEDLSNDNLVGGVVKKIVALEERLVNNPNKYPEHIMQYLRQREGLDKHDTSMDNKLNELTPNKAFKEVLNWNGLLGSYDDIIKDWVNDIYGINLDEIESK